VSAVWQQALAFLTVVASTVVSIGVIAGTVVSIGVCAVPVNLASRIKR
jgi:hypothetical protein